MQIIIKSHTDHSDLSNRNKICEIREICVTYPNNPP